MELKSFKLKGKVVNLFEAENSEAWWALSLDRWPFSFLPKVSYLASVLWEWTDVDPGNYETLEAILELLLKVLRYKVLFAPFELKFWNVFLQQRRH